MLLLSDISNGNVFPNCIVYAFLNYPSLLWPYTLSFAITSPYRRPSRRIRATDSRIRNYRRLASSACRGRVPRIQMIAGELFTFVRSDGNKIVREETESSAAARGKEDASSLPDPVFARSFLRLLAALASVARSCSDRISKDNYVSIASIVVNRGARPNMGLLATTITIATTTIGSVHHYRSEEERLWGRGLRGRG